MQNTQDYKNQLLTLRDEFSSRLDALNITLTHKDEAVEKDFAEQATQAENDDVLNALDNETKNMLIQIDNALLRIKDESYGKCVSCGKGINEQRLKVVPYAALCIACAEKEKNA